MIKIGDIIYFKYNVESVNKKDPKNSIQITILSGI